MSDYLTDRDLYLVALQRIADLQAALSNANFSVDLQEKWLADYKTELETAESRIRNLEDILGELRLYVDWQYCTRQLTTDQKELWADCVDAWSSRLNYQNENVADRWWRE